MEGFRGCVRLKYGKRGEGGMSYISRPPVNWLRANEKMNSASNG